MKALFFAVILDGQLSNKNFVERAPKENVDELQERAKELESQIVTVKSRLDALT